MLIFAIVMLATYLVVRNKVPRSSGGHFISVIERKYITKNSCIAIIRVIENYYVVLITENGGTILEKLDSIDAGDLEKTNFKVEFFKNILKKGEKK